MLTVYIKGLLLGLAMIVPIGPQNAFVITQGIRRQYHLMVAGLCALSDMTLIALGVLGGGALLGQSELLLQGLTWAGALFLFWYGWGALRAAWNSTSTTIPTTNTVVSRSRIIFLVLAVTWLNPHVYLDTIVILGSLGGQLAEKERLWFAVGAMSASVIWFFTLALLAARLSSWLQSPIAQRVIHILVGVIMWLIAYQLVRQGVAAWY